MAVNQPLSVEFFPPRSAKGLQQLLSVVPSFQALSPEYASVTFGAGGSTQQATPDTVAALQATGLDVAPHISCITATEAMLHTLLERYQQQGVKRLVVLRGDRPDGRVTDLGPFRYANELVAFIRAHYGDAFVIEVGCYPEGHPESDNLNDDFTHFANKVRAGADAAITQYFYNVDSYCYYRDRCVQAGLSIPIVPGVMPIASFSKLLRFSSICGAEIPLWIKRQMQGLTEADQRAFGLDVVTELCARLLAEGAPGLHFYTLNQLEPTQTIVARLRSSGVLQGELTAAATES